MNKRVCTSGGMITYVFTDKPAPIPFCPPQITGGLACLQTWASKGMGWQLTA